MSRFEARQAYIATMEEQRKAHGKSLKVLPLPGARFYDSGDAAVRDPVQEVHRALEELQILQTAE